MSWLLVELSYKYPSSSVLDIIKDAIEYNHPSLLETTRRYWDGHRAYSTYDLISPKYTNSFILGCLERYNAKDIPNK